MPRSRRPVRRLRSRPRVRSLAAAPRAAAALLLAVALALLGGCAREDEGPSASRPDVVILLVDTLRADWLHLYGGPEGTSPRLDALAREAVVFENAHAPAPWTLPSVASLFTARFVPEHGVVRDGQKLAPQIPTLAERFRALGYATASFAANPYAGEMSGLDRGFQVHEITSEPGHRAVAWLREPPSEPMLLYVHRTEPHDPFMAAPEDVAPFGEVSAAARRRIAKASTRYRRLTRADWEAERPIGTVDNAGLQDIVMERLDEDRDAYARLYSGAVREADAGIGAVLDALEAAGRLEEAVVVVLSDHGEEMGEHGGWQHDQSVYEELVRVPLLIRLPGGAHGDRRVAQPVSLVDVAPTLLELAGAGPQPGARGRSLLPLLRGAADAEPEPRVTAVRWNEKKYYRPFAETRGDLNLVVRDGRWKAIWNVEPDRVELYDLAADPGERHDLAAEHPARAARLREVAAARLQAYRETSVAPAADGGALDPEMRARLEALGYLSPEAEEPDAP